jgi:hypothetical protein
MQLSPPNSPRFLLPSVIHGGVLLALIFSALQV